MRGVYINCTSDKGVDISRSDHVVFVLVETRAIFERDHSNWVSSQWSYGTQSKFRHRETNVTVQILDWVRKPSEGSNTQTRRRRKVWTKKNSRLLCWKFHWLGMFFTPANDWMFQRFVPRKRDQLEKERRVQSKLVYRGGGTSNKRSSTPLRRPYVPLAIVIPRI